MVRTSLACVVLAASVAGAGPAAGQLPTGDQLLVTPQWLVHHLHDRDLAILQVGPEAGYRKEHIAGSQFVALHDISTAFQPGSLALEMPPEAALRATLERLGVSDRTRVVVVSDSGWVTPSSRLFLTLGYAGLGDHAVYLDGGLTAWRAAGLPLTADAAPAAPGRFTRRFVPSVIVDQGFVAAHRSAPHVKLVDARSPDSYAGAATQQELAGHIPGAINLPWHTFFVDSTDRLVGRSELEQRFRAAGVEPGDTVVAYCHVGQIATAVLLAARVTGHPVRLYDGSFQDWSMRKLPTEGGK